MKYLKGDCNIGLVLPQKVGGGGFSRKMEQESCDERVIVWVQREFGGGGCCYFCGMLTWVLEVKLQRGTTESCYHRCVCVCVSVHQMCAPCSERAIQVYYSPYSGGRSAQMFFYVFSMKLQQKYSSKK